MLLLYFHRVIKSAYPTMINSRPMLMGVVLLAAATLGRAQSGDTDASKAAVSQEPAASRDNSSEADDRLARAERHFNAGRQFYFQDNVPSARREFDAAIEALLNAPESLPDYQRIERRLE